MPGGWPNGWFLALAALLLTALVAPLRTARRWRGGWRAAALLPLGLLLAAVAGAVLGLESGRLRPALAPFHVALACLGAILLTSVLHLLHALLHTRRPE